MKRIRTFTRNSSTALAPALLALLVGSCSALPRPQAEISNPGEMLFNGYTHDNVNCYCCHSKDGSGTWKGANLSGIGTRESRESLMSLIRSGPSIMPSYADDLTGEELDLLVDWLETLE